MSKTLREIAERLKGSDKKVQLIYAFNGKAKRACRGNSTADSIRNANGEVAYNARRCRIVAHKILYYNAFTEDLFYWDNDLELDAEHAKNP